MKNRLHNVQIEWHVCVCVGWLDVFQPAFMCMCVALLLSTGNLFSYFPWVSLLRATHCIHRNGVIKRMQILRYLFCPAIRKWQETSTNIQDALDECIASRKSKFVPFPPPFVNEGKNPFAKCMLTHSSYKPLIKYIKVTTSLVWFFSSFYSLFVERASFLLVSLATYFSLVRLLFFIFFFPLLSRCHRHRLLCID